MDERAVIECMRRLLARDDTEECRGARKGGGREDMRRGKREEGKIFGGTDGGCGCYIPIDRDILLAPHWAAQAT